MNNLLSTIKENIDQNLEGYCVKCVLNGEKTREKRASEQKEVCRRWGGGGRWEKSGGKIQQC